MLEDIVKDAPDLVDAHVQLATAYNRLKRLDDAAREKAIVDRLNADAAAKQKGRGGAISDLQNPISRLHTSRGFPDGAATGSEWKLAIGRLETCRRMRRSALLLLAILATAAAQTSKPASTVQKEDSGESAFIGGGAIRPAGGSGDGGAQGGEVGRRHRALREDGRAAAEVHEGYWYQGSAYYTLQKFTECRDRFREVVKLAPQNGAAFAFLGLCRVKARRNTTSRCIICCSRGCSASATPAISAAWRGITPRQS